MKRTTAPNSTNTSHTAADTQAKARSPSWRLTATARQARWGITIAAIALLGYAFWSGLQFAFLYIRIHGVTSIDSIELIEPHPNAKPYHSDVRTIVVTEGPFTFVDFPSVPFRSGKNTLRIKLTKDGHSELRTCVIDFRYARCTAEVFINSHGMSCHACVYD